MHVSHMTELADQCASSNHLASSTERQQMTEMLPYSADQLRFCQALPKIELHAHLNGSIRESTIRYSSRPGGASTPMTSATALITVVVCLQRASRKTRTECRDPRVSFKDRHANFSSSCVEGGGCTADLSGWPAGTRSLPEGFKLFAVIHTITTTHAILTRIAREVVEDCAHDNIVHLELRTTPKVCCSAPNNPEIMSV